MLVSNILFVLSVLGNGGSGDLPQSGVKGYKHGKPYFLYVSSIHQKDSGGDSLSLSSTAAERFREMTTAAAQDGFYLRVTSAYRTYRQQFRLKRRKGDFAAKPGWSTHQQGMSIDICGTTKTIGGKKYRTILYWWMVRNARKYGFYNDVEEELWHWTFIKDGIVKKKKRPQTKNNKGNYI